MADAASLFAASLSCRVADLAAPLHHLDKDEMLGEDVRQFRKTRRLVRAAIAGLVALTLVATGAAAIAVTQQRVAEEQRNLAEDRLLLATSRQLAAQAEAASATDTRTAARLALAGLSIHDNDQTRAGLLRAVTGQRASKGDPRMRYLSIT